MCRILGFRGHVWHGQKVPILPNTFWLVLILLGLARRQGRMLCHYSCESEADAAAGAPALLALHGGLGWDHRALRPWLDPLGERACLTYLDLLGCGASPGPDDWTRVTHATWAEGVEETRRRLDAERGLHDRVVLFGHSYGAVIAMEAALRYPERVSGLILCAAPTAAEHVPAALERVLAHAAAVGPDVERAFRGLLATPPETDDAFADAMRSAIAVYVRDPGAHDLAGLVDRVRFRAAPARRSFYELFGSYDVRPRLAEIAAPTLVLSGRHDWLAPPDEAPAEMLDRLPEAEGHVFEQSGHLPFLEENGAFLSVVGDWLNRRASAATRPAG